MAASDPNLYAFELIFKALNDSKTPVSKSKIQSITEHAIKAQKYYKHVVMHIEGFIRKSSPKHKLPGIYVIDSILRISRRKGKEKDVFASRFAKNLGVTFACAAKCVEEDKFKVFRCFKLWKEGHFFPDEVIDPIVKKIDAVESFENVAGAGRDVDPGDQQDTENDQELELVLPKNSPSRKKLSEEKTNLVKSESPKNAKSAEKVRFDKRLLDFDYSDEEEGDTQRSGKRSKKRAPEEAEDFFVMGKDGKPEFAIDKIMSGLRQSRTSQPSTMFVAASPEPPSMENTDENNEMELSSPGPSDLIELPSAAGPPEPAMEKPIVLKSCTVWVGHLPKGVAEVDLKKAMSEYGGVSTLDLIPSRGCAYVSYEKRRHAETAVRSRRDLWKLFGDKVKISWGPGRGIKSGYKQWNWDADTGICEIKPSLLPALCRDLADGCELLMESVPEKLKARFSDLDEEDNAPVSAATGAAGVVPGNPSRWETTAAVGFAPLETHIKTWDALLQSQAPNPGPAHPPLPLAFDVLQPPSFPPFFPSAALPNLPGPMTTTHTSSPPKQQNGSAIPTISGQTSWTDPITPKSSLFSKMKSAEDFVSILGENEATSVVNSANPLFLKPPPPLGTPQFPTNQPGPPMLNPALFFANLNLANNAFPGNLLAHFGGHQNFGQGLGQVADRNGPPPLPIFRGLGPANGSRLNVGVGVNGLPGLDGNLPTSGMGTNNRFSGNGNDNGSLGERFGAANKDAGHRFAGPDIRLPLHATALANQFSGGPMRPQFGQNEARFPPPWNSAQDRPRMEAGATGGRDRRANFEDDHRNLFSSNDNRPNFPNNGNRQNFQNNDTRRTFQNNNVSHRGANFDGQEFPPRSFQQRTQR